MKIQVPFLALCLAAFTNLDLILGAPHPSPAPTGINGNVVKLGHSSTLVDQKITFKTGPVEHPSTSQHHHDITTMANPTPQEVWKSRTMTPQEREALHSFKSRPRTKADADAIPVKDFTKITHQDHLNDLDADGATHLANRVLRHTDMHINDRMHAHIDITTKGGVPGKMRTGRPEDESFHTKYANAQRELNQLVGPLTAVEQAAALKGDLVTANGAYKRKDAIKGGQMAPKEMDQEFNNHVGNPSFYHPYVTYDHSSAKPGKDVGKMEKDTDNGKSTQPINQINSRL